MPRIPASERRAALARAALTVIARDGLAAATTRAIVAEAGMPLASFHYAVASRDELLRDVIELVVAAEGVAAGGLLAQAETPRDAIRGALNGYLDHVRSDPGAEQAMFELTQYALRTPELADLPAEQYRRYHELVADLLEAGASSLNIEWSIPVPDLARLMVTLTDGLTLAWLADRDDAAAGVAIDHAADAISAFARAPRIPAVIA
ncbi:MAG: TetR family transcriptional regulator C-terminal domain-containing protein [Microbacteriaceae bacterium]|nr:TetR family transcriptional regulator C-terminal domain-containing protein [Microbacteriaceae bacterium]